jgi:hypothetical protein
VRGLALLRFLTVCGLLVRPGLGQSELDALLPRLAEPVLDERVLSELESQPTNNRIIAALQTAFENRGARRERQWIAVTLLRLGQRSDQYFNFLASYARQAIEDRAPFYLKFDSEGRAVRGQFSAEFENWCVQNHKDAKEVAAAQMSVYLEDVMLLARAEDPRAIDLLRRGLDSPNPLIVAYSVQGLGRLQDIAAISLIAKACDRLRASDCGVVAMQLPWYARPEAYQLMERLVPNRSLRNHQIEDVEQTRLLELQRIEKRKAVPN